MFLHYSPLLFAFPLLPNALGIVDTQGKSGPIINTSSGSYVGVNDAQNGVDSFKGIRYAAPPTRFAPAVPFSKAPQGVQSAVAFGQDCPQQPLSLSAVNGYALGPPLGGTNISEDCLFLNVWRPAFPSNSTEKNSKLPILVWLHGGGYAVGSGSEWNGTSLVRRSVATNKPFIFISVSYRLGIFGFLGSAQVPPSALNAGLLDQRAALRWIQENAKAFGGDAARVTIAGESVGGGSVHMHYLYPDSKPTFRAGISSSGTSLVINTQYPVKKVIAGDFLKLPIITGTNLDEGGLAIGRGLLDITPPPTIDEENTILSGFIAAQGTKNVSQETINQLLDLNSQPTDQLSNSTLYDRAVQFTTDYRGLAPQRLFLKSASANERQQNVWAYSFQQHLPGAPDFLGVFHSSDLYYLDMGFAQVPTSKLVPQMQDFYISFVNEFKPGASWPKYNEESKMVMRLLDERVGPLADTLRRKQTDFLSQVDVMEQFGRFG